MTTPEAQPATNGAGTAEQTSAEVQVGTSSQTAASPGSDYKSLLQEYEAKTTPATVADLSRFAKLIEPVVGFVEEKRVGELQSQLQKDIDDSVSVVKGDLPDEWKTIARGHIEGLVATKDDYRNAWENRSKNPEAWKEKCTLANADLAKLRNPQSTNDVRTDIDRAAAAVRNISTEPPRFEQPDPVTAMRMSDRDWEAYKAKVRAANQSG